MSLQQVHIVLDVTLRESATGLAVAGKSIDFSYKLTTDATFTAGGIGTTDTNGLASSPTLSLFAPDAYDFLATFNGDVLFQMSSAQVVYDTTVQSLTTALTASVYPTNPKPTDQVTVSGTLVTTSAGASTPLPGEIVQITLDTAAPLSTTTDSNGLFSTPLGMLSAGNHIVTVVFQGATIYLGSSHQSSFTVGTTSPPPQQAGIAPLAIVAIIAVTGIGIYMSRRGKKKG